MVGEGAETKAGTPFVEGVCVAGEVVEQARGDKILVFKKKRRQNYRRTSGHRQDLTVVRITDILTDGKKPEARPRKAAAPKADEAKTGAQKAPAKRAAPKKKAAPKKTAAKTADSKKPAAKQKADKKKEEGYTADRKRAEEGK